MDIFTGHDLDGDGEKDVWVRHSLPNPGMPLWVLIVGAVLLGLLITAANSESEELLIVVAVGFGILIFGFLFWAAISETSWYRSWSDSLWDKYRLRKKKECSRRGQHERKEQAAKPPPVDCPFCKMGFFDADQKCSCCGIGKPVHPSSSQFIQQPYDPSEGGLNPSQQLECEHCGMGFYGATNHCSFCGIERSIGRTSPPKKTRP